ncbi:Hypothetical predicted protein [Cloeon dipterum]|uniref:Histone chaperone domain-containing protein n=1 Tax=Cloeon dipterum TaxID=197152 RepID=A0A8S1CJ90_9INSE|nr:Hypothetical predicted protein [Cloeon dipterum]
MQDSDEDVPLIKLKNSLRQLNKDVPLARLKKAVQQEISDEDVPLIKLKIPANQPDITPSADTKIPTKDDVPLAKLRRPIFTDHPLRVRGSSNPEECMDGTCGNKKGHSSSDDDCSSKQSNESEVERGSDGPGKNSGSDDGKEDDQDKKRNIKSPKDNASDEEMEEETEESNEVSSDESEGKLQKPKRVLKKKRVSPNSEDDMPLKRQSNVANSESSSHSEDGRFNATGKQQISDSDDDKPIATLKKMSAKSCKDKKKEKTKKGPKVTSDEEIEDNMSSNDNSDQSERKLKKLTVKKRSPSVLLDSDSSDEDASFNMKSKGSLKKRKSPESKSKKNSPANKSKLSTSIPSKDKVTLCPKKSISRTLAQNDFDSEDDKPFKLLKRQSKSADSESTSDTDGGKDKSSKSAEPSKKPPVSGSQKGHKKMLAKGTNKDEGSSTSDSDSETENRKLKMKKSLSTNASSDSENDKPLEIKNKPQKKQNSSDSDDDKPLVALKKESGKTSKLMSNQDKKIEKLKRYLKEAGINFVPYKKISEQCNGNGKKIAEKLLSLLHEKGLKGTPSIEKCRKLKKKLELKKDRESLDLGNIIQDGATCIRRSQVTAKPMKRKAESSSDSEKEKAKKKYSRLLSLADNSSD